MIAFFFEYAAADKHAALFSGGQVLLLPPAMTFLLSMCGEFADPCCMRRVCTVGSAPAACWLPCPREDNKRDMKGNRWMEGVLPACHWHWRRAGTRRGGARDGRYFATTLGKLSSLKVDCVHAVCSAGPQGAPDILQPLKVSGVQETR